MHIDHFMPDKTYNDSDLLANGNGFSVNRVAMNWVQLWYQCCTGDVNWDAAVPPVAPNGEQPSKLHADTFRLLEGSKNPEAAFKVLWYMLTEGAPDLLQVYGAFPSIPEQADGFIAGLDEKFPQGVNWQVALDGLNHPDNPSHEGFMPNYNQAFSRLQAFQNLYKTDPNLDLQAEIDTLQAELQLIFDAAR
jgi:ABC-type glycerol-3-phosphate transport system substrate-binding protein